MFGMGGCEVVPLVGGPFDGFAVCKHGALYVINNAPAGSYRQVIGTGWEGHPDTPAQTQLQDDQKILFVAPSQSAMYRLHEGRLTFVPLAPTAP